MKEVFHLTVHDESECDYISPYVGKKDFLRFVKFAKKHSLVNILRGGKLVPHKRYSTDSQDFICEPTNPAVPKLLEMLSELGWKLREGYVSVNESREGTYYTYSIVRHFSPEDISACAYLYLFSVGSECEGGRYGNVSFVDQLADCWVGASRELESSETFLSLGLNNFFFQEELADSFRDCVGLRFEEALKWQGEDMGQFLEFDSSLTLPSCQLPVVQMDDIRRFEEGVYTPPILRYSKQDFDDLGAFDVAKVKEEQGGRPGQKGQAFVISASFYKKLIAAGAKVSVHPVALD